MSDDWRNMTIEQGLARGWKARKAGVMAAQADSNPEGRRMGGKVLFVSLPLPVSVNSMYRSIPLPNGQVKVLLSSAARDFKKHATKEAEGCSLEQRWRYQDGSKLKFTLYAMTPKSNIDLDNMAKITIDSLAAGLGFNDKCITEIHLYKIFNETPGCQVELEVV